MVKKYNLLKLVSRVLALVHTKNCVPRSENAVKNYI